MDLKLVLAIAGVAVAGVAGFFIGKSMCGKEKKHHPMMHPMMMGHHGGKPGMGHPYMQGMGMHMEDDL